MRLTACPFLVAFLCAAEAIGEETSKNDMWKLLTNPEALERKGPKPPELDKPGFPAGLGRIRAGKEVWEAANLRYEFGSGWLQVPEPLLEGMGRRYFNASELLAVAVFHMPLPRGGGEQARGFLEAKHGKSALIRVIGEGKAEGRAEELGMRIFEFESVGGVAREIGLGGRMTRGGVGYVISVTGSDMEAARGEFDRLLNSLSWIDEGRDGSVPPVEALSLGWAGIRIPCDGEWLTPQPPELPNGVSAGWMTRRLELTAFDVRGMTLPARQMVTALLETMAVAEGGNYRLEDATWGGVETIRARPKRADGAALPVGMDWVLDAAVRDGFLCVAFGVLIDDSPETLKRHGEHLSRVVFSAPAGKVPEIPGAEQGRYAALIYNNIGLAAFEDGKFGIASVAFKKSMDLNASDPTVAENLANSLNEQGRTAAALEVIEQAAAAHPKHAGIGLWRAMLLAKSERHAEASKLFESLYRKGMREEGALISWIGALQAGGDHKRAAEVAREMHAETGRISWQRVLADCLWTAGDLAGAHEQFQLLAPEISARASAAVAALDLQKEFPGEGWVVLEDVRTWHWQKGEDASCTHRQRIRILGASGVTAFSTLYIPFKPTSERVTVHRLDVIPADGGETACFRDAEVHVRDSGGGIADGSKLVCIPVPSLKEGAVIDFVHTKRLLGTAERHPMVTDMMQEGSPLVYGAVVFTGGLEGVRFATNPGLEAVSGDSWRAWEAARPARRKGQSHLPPYAAWGRICWAGPADLTWQQEASDYLGEIRGILDDDGFAAQVADDLRLSEMPPREAIRAVVRWMNLKFQYQGLEFGRRARIPAKGADTLARSFGDCKDFSILLRGILREAGIKAELALTHSGGTVRPEIASLDQFDHMVVYLPDQGGLLLDGTVRHFNTPEALPSSAMGVPVFRLEAAEPGFVMPSESADIKRGARIERDVEIDADGNATVREVVVMEPTVAASFRYAFSSSPAAEHLRMMDQMIRRMEPRVQLTRFDAADLVDSFLPLRMELDYVVKGAFQHEEGRFHGTIPVVMERWLMEVEPERDRTLGMSVRMEESYASTTRVKAPAGAEWLPFEAPRTSPDACAFFAATVEAEGEGRNATIKANFRLTPHEGGLEDFNRFVESTRHALQRFGGRVRFKLPDAGDVRPPADPDTQEK
jgi:hypothetical protein